MINTTKNNVVKKLNNLRFDLLPTRVKKYFKKYPIKMGGNKKQRWKEYEKHQKNLIGKFGKEAENPSSEAYYESIKYVIEKLELYKKEFDF